MIDAPRLSLRIDLPPKGRIGPGKIALLEHIAATGSISAGARAMKMSYRQAWSLVEELTQLFGRPVILAQKGGPGGGGAELTALGLALVTRYRAVERAATAAAQSHLDALAREIDES